MNALRYISLLLFVDVLSCRQPYLPPVIQAKNNWLVVDGFINAGSDSTNIRLSRSRSLSDSNYAIIPETRATVSVLGSNSESYPLQELGNGLYSTPGLNLSLSETYKLSIVTSNGEQYRSDSLVPAVSPTIDSILWHADSTGMYIYLNTHDPSGRAKYYQWDYTETWERQVTFNSELEWVGGQLIFRQPQNQIFTCWKTQNSTSLLLASSAALTQDVISMQPIESIPMGDERMVIEYSILVRQHVLDPGAYTYWQNLLSTTELTGSIFDPQPSQVLGNIHSLTNPTEPVFGSVSASTESMQRIFISRYDFSYWLYPPPVCVTDTFQLNDISVFADTTYLVPVKYLFPIYLGAEAACADCRYGGASNVKPLFWPN
jgi:hypothetical protein